MHELLKSSPEYSLAFWETWRVADTGWRTENINLLFTFIKFSEASSEAFALITFCPLQAFSIRVAFEADSLKHYQNNLEHKSRNRIAFTHFEKNKDHNHVSALSVLRAHPLLSSDCPPLSLSSPGLGRFLEERTRVHHSNYYLPAAEISMFRMIWQTLYQKLWIKLADFILTWLSFSTIAENEIKDIFPNPILFCLN